MFKGIMFHRVSEHLTMVKFLYHNTITCSAGILVLSSTEKASGAWEPPTGRMTK